MGVRFAKTLYSLSGRSGSTTVLDATPKPRHVSGSAVSDGDIGFGEGLDPKKLRNFSSSIDLSQTPTSRKQQSQTMSLITGRNNCRLTENTRTTYSARNSLGNQLVVKEGYLSKKTATNTTGLSFPTSLSRGWKVYRVTLRGAKLSFYKPPPESLLREQFPNDTDPRASVMMPPDDGDADGPRMPLNPGEVDTRTRSLLYESSVRAGVIISPLSQRYVFGECFSEIDSHTFKFKRYACVLIFDDTIVVLKRKWIKQNIASSFIGAVSNKMRLSRTFTHRKSKTSQKSPAEEKVSGDNASLASADLSIQGKGYFTKWQH